MPQQRFDLIVFDWDGTLMDSTSAITRSIQLACRDLDLPVPDDAHARKQHQLRIAAEVMKTITFRQLAVVGRVERRHRVFERIAQPQTDHVACCRTRRSGL